MTSLDTAIIKRVEDKYEVLDGIDQGGGLPTFIFLLMRCLI